MRKDAAVEKLDPNILDNYFKAKEELEEISREAQSKVYSFYNPITNRINHILREVLPQAYPNFNLSWWGFLDCTENDDGDFDRSLEYADDGRIALEGEWSFGVEYRTPAGHVAGDILHELPVEYLYWSDEEIVQSILDEIKDEEDRRALSKQKREKKKAEKAAVKAVALSKLSKEEREALGLK